MDIKESENVLKRDYVIHNLLVPIIINLLSTLLVFVVTFFLSLKLSIPYWITLAIAFGIIILIFSLSKQNIALRSLRLRLLKEVSSSKCGEYFILLALYYFKRHSLANKAILDLPTITRERRHPGTKLLQPILDAFNSGNYSREQVIDMTIRYLSLSQSAKRRGREEVVQNVTKFLSNLNPHTYIVLYGYSSTICEALVAVGKYLPCPIFLIQDLQYGVAGSLGEHLEAQRSLEKGSITPIMLHFEQIEALRSKTANFVRTINNHLVPLESDRRIIAIIGCEACDARGAVLIPSKLIGQPSETYKFIEIFRPTGLQSAQLSVETQILVVAESYKVYKTFDDQSNKTFAPLKIYFIQKLLYLCGFNGAISPIPVELVKLHPSDLYAIIDDSGIHLSKGDRIDLSPSITQWEERTIRRAFTVIIPNNIKLIFQSCKAVIFDLNGVLINDESIHYAAFTDLVSNHGNTLNYQEYLQECSGLSDEEGIRNLLEKDKVSGKISELLATKQKLYDNHASTGQIRAFPMATELVNKLFTEKKCYLVTSASKQEVETFLRETGLENIFLDSYRYVNVRAINRQKIYLEIIDKSGGNPTECVLLDDSPTNLTIAKSEGMRTVGFATTRVIDVRVDVVVEGAQDLLAQYTI